MEKKCKICNYKRDSKKGYDRKGNPILREFCKKCYNKKMREYKKTTCAKEYFRKYIKNYMKARLCSDLVFKKKVYAINNKSNKKAISELKNSYIKNRLSNGKKHNPLHEPLIELKKESIKLNRLINGFRK